MPGMDGLEVLRRMQARAPTARVIMVTAFASIELAVDAMKLGATDFLRKPMTPESLRSAVAAAIAARGWSRPHAGRPSHGRLDRLETGAPEIPNLALNGFQILRDRAAA